MASPSAPAGAHPHPPTGARGMRVMASPSPRGLRASERLRAQPHDGCAGARRRVDVPAKWSRGDVAGGCATVRHSSTDTPAKPWPPRPPRRTQQPRGCRAGTRRHGGVPVQWPHAGVPGMTPTRNGAPPADRPAPTMDAVAFPAVHPHPHAGGRGDGPPAVRCWMRVMATRRRGLRASGGDHPAQPRHGRAGARAARRHAEAGREPAGMDAAPSAPPRPPPPAAPDHGRRAAERAGGHQAARSVLCHSTRPPGSIARRTCATGVHAARRHPGEVSARRRPGGSRRPGAPSADRPRANHPRGRFRRAPPSARGGRDEGPRGGGRSGRGASRCAQRAPWQAEPADFGHREAIAHAQPRQVKRACRPSWVTPRSRPPSGTSGTKQDLGHAPNDGIKLRAPV